MDRELTCVECPMGCTIVVTIRDGEIVSICGNTCARGKLYAQNEVFSPKRVVTSTVKLEGGGMLPVKTDRPVDKDKIFEVMAVINSLIVSAPVKVGDVVASDVCGANIISAKEVL